MTDRARPAIDIEQLRERYRIERDKRIHGGGIEQYVEPVGRHAHFLEDPHADPDFVREPVELQCEVAIVGGGLGGLLTAVRLSEAGIHDIRIIERGADFGGTWYWNRYPGCRCDVESYVYMPLLEETGYIPTEKYATAGEIFEHMRRIGRKFSLYDRALFQTVVTEMAWDEAASRWTVKTDRGDSVSARFVVNGLGLLAKPKLPGIPGIETFKGRIFHTSRWDYGYTGGGPAGGMTGLADKTVGIVGTGATAIQCIPYLAEDAARLFVFQRTPSAVDVRNNTATDPDWAGSLEPGWQAARSRNFNETLGGQPVEVDLVDDGWTSMRVLVGKLKEEMGDAMSQDEIVQLADFHKQEEIRRRVDTVVTNPETAAALKAYYNRLCKRPGFHDGYLETFNRPDVTLVDTQGKGVERVDETGVFVNGVHYPLDCLVLATGFEFASTSYKSRAGFEIEGVGGRTLSEKWRDGVVSLHGEQVHGFPNCFLLNLAQTGVTANYGSTLDEHARQIAHIVGYCRDHGIVRAEVTEEAEQAWLADVNSFMPVMLGRWKDCTPGYLNGEGNYTDREAQNGPYGGGFILYARKLAEWRAKGGLPGMKLTKPGA